MLLTIFHINLLVEEVPQQGSSPIWIHSKVLTGNSDGLHGISNRLSSANYVVECSIFKKIHFVKVPRLGYGCTQTPTKYLLGYSNHMKLPIGHP